MAAPVMAGTRGGGVQAPMATGAINGTAQSSTGQMLSNFTVHARNLQTGQLAGTTTSNAAGSFSFAGLSPANYIVEVVNPAGVIVGSSASIAVAAGASVSVTVSATVADTSATGRKAAAGVSTAVVVTAIAAAAGIAGVVVAVKNNASPSR